MPPGQAGANKFLIQVPAVRKNALGHRASVSVNVLHVHRDGLSEGRVTGELLRLRSDSTSFSIPTAEACGMLILVCCDGLPGSRHHPSERRTFVE